MRNEGYTTQMVPIGSLPEPLVAAMARLYLQHYDGSCEALFRADLHAKDEVILLYHNAALVGFTSLLVYGAQWQGQAVRVVYSGDTIVARAHWGQQALAPAFITRLAHIRQAAPDQPLYWFLLVKGHRTYKYLAVFAERFYPHWAQQHRLCKLWPISLHGRGLVMRTTLPTACCVLPSRAAISRPTLPPPCPKSCANRLRAFFCNAIQTIDKAMNWSVCARCGWTT